MLCWKLTRVWIKVRIVSGDDGTITGRVDVTSQKFEVSSKARTLLFLQCDLEKVHSSDKFYLLYDGDVDDIGFFIVLIKLGNS